jgi:hypothetical protein
MVPTFDKTGGHLMKKLTFNQEKGADVELVVFGDEHYARYESEQGFTAVYDPKLGLYCYALVVDGQFKSSGVPITEEPPAGIQPHAKESDVTRQTKAAEKIKQRTPPDAV